MNGKEYRNTRPGDTLITNRELRNGNYILPKGSVVTVDRKHGGFTLSSPACECCGVRVFITRVEAWAVEVAPIKREDML